MIRRANPALQTHLGVAFHNAFNDQVLWYRKATADRGNVVLLAVSLDPRNVQEAAVELPLWEWGLPDHAALEAEDLMTRAAIHLGRQGAAAAARPRGRCPSASGASARREASDGPRQRRQRQAPQRPQGGGCREPQWYRDAVIYQLHVKSFFDANDDGIGDFAGLLQKLDYIAELGVDTLWLLPFYPSPLRDDGYDIADYRGVNPELRHAAGCPPLRAGSACARAAA